MLQAIRNNAQGLFVWIIVGLIVISFALFGLGSYLSGASKVVAASVNGTEISSTELTRAYQNYQERLRQMFGDQYRPEMFGTARMKQEVLQGLITQEVMNQMIHEQGFKASDAQVLEKLKQYEAFQEGGTFSASRYKQVLSQQGVNGEAFENDLSRDIATQQIQATISSSAFLTEKEKNNLAELENQKRKIGYFDVPVAPYKKLVKVTDEDIQTSYKNNSQQYLTDEKVKLDYLELNMNEVAARQDVSDDMIKQHYENSPESYMADDNSTAKKKISDIREQIINGADFEKLAQEFSDDKGSAKQGGDLGYLTRGIEENFDKAVFALKKGEVSQVISSKEGFQLVKVDDIRSGDPEERKVRHILIKAEKKLQPLAQIKDKVKKDIQYQQASKVFFTDADKMNNLSYESPNSLEPVADATGLKLKTSDLISRKGGTGLFANPKVINAAFSHEVLKEGRNSELIELSDSHYIVLRVKEHKPSAVIELDKVKSQISDNLISEKARKKAEEVTAEILKRVNNNENIADITKGYPEIKWVDSGWIKRKTNKESVISVGLPDKIRQHAFAMPKPESEQVSWDKVSMSTGGQAVLAVFKVENAKEELLGNDIRRITTILGNTDYNAFIQYQKSQAEITVFQAAIEAEPNQ